jgi:hypothetical protein
MRTRREHAGVQIGRALSRLADRAVRRPALVVLSYVIGPTPMSLQFWPAAAAMILIATMTAFVATNSGRSAWFLGGALARRIFDFRHDAILVAAQNSLNRVKERRMPLALISFHRGTL